MFFKCSIALGLSNCLNAKKKKYISNTKYTIQHRIESSKTTKCIQYNIHDKMSCELPNCFFLAIFADILNSTRLKIFKNKNYIKLNKHFD